MAEKRVIELEIQTNEKSLKAQLREAQADVQKLSEKFGATSDAAVQAAKKAAELKDAIGDAKALTDAFNPDAKFNALSSSIGGVLNGFQAFEGALGLVGVESEAVQESLLKVQSAMDLASGVDAVLESVDSFKTLGAQVMKFGIVQKIVTAGQWLWNTAVAANPIGALTVAITGLIAAGYALVKYFQTSTAENEKNAASIKNSTHELKKQNLELEKSQTRLEKSNQFQLDYAKASGKSAEEVRKLALANQEAELALARKNKELAKSSYLLEKDKLASMRSRGASEEDIKKQEELVKKYGEAATEARKIAQQEYQDLKDLRNQQKIERKQEQTDEIKEKKENAKSSVDTQKDGLNAELEQIKEFNKQAKESNAARLRTDKENEEFAVNQKYESQIALFKKHGKDTTQLETAQANELNDIRKKYKDIADKTEQERRAEELAQTKAANEKRIELEDSQFELQESLRQTAKEKEIADLVKSYEDKFAIANGNAELEKQLTEQQKTDLGLIEDKYRKEQEEAERLATEKAKQRQQQRVDLILKYAQTFGQAMGSLNNLLNANDEARLKNVKKGSKEEEAIKRKMFDRDKKLRIVQTVIDTASNVVQSVRNGGGIPAGIPFGIAAGAMGAMQIAAISKTKFDGGGGEQAPSPAGGGGAMQAPNFSVIGSSGVNQLAQLQQQPTRAYVVSGEVTSQQALDRNRVQNATL